MSQLHTSSGFFWKRNFLERQGTKMSSRNIYVTSSVHAKHPLLINLVVLLVLDRPSYNSKSSKLNGLASPFGRKNRKTFSYLWAFVRIIYSAIAMAGPYAWRILCWNPPPASKNELARAASRAWTNDNGTLSYTPAVSHISIPAPAPSLASTKLVAKYTNADLQRATKLALKLFI